VLFKFQKNDAYMRTGISSNTLSKMMLFMALLAAVSMTGCGGGGGGGTLTARAGPAPVSLGTSGDLKAAGNYVILAKTAITNIPTSAITGDIGISPGTAASSIRGLDLVPDATNVFSTSSQVTGEIYASDNATPTPANLTAAVASMEAAYTDAVGRPAGTGANLDLGSGTLNGDNLAPGTYTWTSFPNVDIKGDITLTGAASDVWIFQIPGTLDLESPIQVKLAGGA
jgi:hypothetical protein